MKEKDIHILIERFFEGETSNSEERILYAFFEQENIPEELLKYKPVFQHFSLMQPCNEDVMNRISMPSKRLLWTISGIAATFAVIIGLGLYKKLNNKPFNPYEGSYIIRNGVKITDPETIRPEIEKSLYIVALQNAIDKLEMQEFDF